MRVAYLEVRRIENNCRDLVANCNNEMENPRSKTKLKLFAFFEYYGLARMWIAL